MNGAFSSWSCTVLTEEASGVLCYQSFQLSILQKQEKINSKWFPLISTNLIFSSIVTWSLMFSSLAWLLVFTQRYRHNTQRHCGIRRLFETACPNHILVFSKLPQIVWSGACVCFIKEEERCDRPLTSDTLQQQWCFCSLSTLLCDMKPHAFRGHVTLIWSR